MDCLKIFSLAVRVLAVPAFLWAGADAAAGSGRDAEADTAIAAVVQASDALDGVLFSRVILAATGHAILPIDPDCAHDQRLIAMLGGVMDATLAAFNDDTAPDQAPGRVNEASRHFEEAIAARINALPGWTCQPPRNASGNLQRSGYPDLEIIDETTGRVTYLDPKLHAADSLDSSFRTFYFEPKARTSKVTRDARHLLVGIAHDGGDARRTFVGWRLVDLSQLVIRFKAEFQASNRDLYSAPPLADGGAPQAHDGKRAGQP